MLCFLLLCSLFRFSASILSRTLLAIDFSSNPIRAPFDPFLSLSSFCDWSETGQFTSAGCTNCWATVDKLGLALTLALGSAIFSSIFRITFDTSDRMRPRQYSATPLPLALTAFSLFFGAKVATFSWSSTGGKAFDADISFSGMPTATTSWFAGSLSKSKLSSLEKGLGACCFRSMQYISSNQFYIENQTIHFITTSIETRQRRIKIIQSILSSTSYPFNNLSHYYLYFATCEFSRQLFELPFLKNRAIIMLSGYK